MSRRVVVLRALVLSGVVAIVASCNPFSHSYNSPDPLTLEFHNHKTVVRYRTVNHSLDTTGIVAATANFHAFGTARPSGGLTRTFVGLGGGGATAQLVSADTAAVACTMAIRHFVGYQRRYGGDTARYGQMDDDGVWGVTLGPGGVKAVRGTGETLDVVVPAGFEMPDTVRLNGVLELDITLDMASLFVREAGSARYVLQRQSVIVRQR